MADLSRNSSSSSSFDVDALTLYSLSVRWLTLGESLSTSVPLHSIMWPVGASRWHRVKDCGGWVRSGGGWVSSWLVEQLRTVARDEVLVWITSGRFYFGSTITYFLSKINFALTPQVSDVSFLKCWGVFAQ